MLVCPTMLLCQHPYFFKRLNDQDRKNIFLLLNFSSNCVRSGCRSYIARKRYLTNNLYQIWIPSGSEIGMHVVLACILIHTIYSFHLYRYPSSSKSLIGNKIVNNFLVLISTSTIPQFHSLVLQIHAQECKFARLGVFDLSARYGDETTTC